MLSDQSDQDAHIAELPTDPNRRRRTNACDMCRKSKTRCDGKQPGIDRCSRCSARNWSCEYTGASYRARGRYSGYIEALEAKVQRLECLIKRLLPGQDFTQEVGFTLTRDNWMQPGVCGAYPPDDSMSQASADTGVMPAPATATPDSLSILGPGQAPSLRPVADEGHLSDEEDSLTTKLQQLPAITSAKPQDMSSYLGRSSAAGLLKTAIVLCSRLSAPHAHTGPFFGIARKRPEWLEDLAREETQVSYTFPDPDLLDDFINLYFLHVHTFAPVLHRPTFERDRRSELHLRDRTFGGVVLLICALAERFSQDSRVLAEGEQKRQSFGWKWFSQVRLYDATRMRPNSHLHGLQLISLGVMYGLSITHFHAWIHAGLGIRLALDIGAHKRRAYGATPTVEDELYKRNFWMLVHLDRVLSSTMGRPCCIQEEDFDLDLPLCCDDEYITHVDPERVAQQPDGRPSYTSHFIWTLKLSQIYGLTLRTLYASTKARAHYNFAGEDWTTRTTAHLDSLLNDWAESIPVHLRWDPKRSDDLFFCQSAHLHLHYYMLRIMVHRQSLANPEPTPTSSVALTICMNAARSMVHVLNALAARAPSRIGLVRLDAAIAALVMLVGTGMARLNKLPDFNQKQAMADIDMMIGVLRLQEDRWRCSGNYADALTAFKSLSDDTSLGPQLTRKPKRRYEDDGIPVQTQQRSAPRAMPHALGVIQDRDQWREGLNSPSIFTASNDEAFGAGDPLPDATMSSSDTSGAFFGNINLGALFGFDHTSFEDASMHIPNDLDGNMGVPNGGSSLNTEGLDASGPVDWMGMSFDFGLGDWQWPVPAAPE
ncbi:unnamed protein product [Peniophora sp. CBMAI 1063]|nr:unnamed protein product [Peniophora sp. CBMAI 1063]